MAFVVELKQFPQPRNAAGVPGVARAEVSMLAKGSQGRKAACPGQCVLEPIEAFVLNPGLASSPPPPHIMKTGLNGLNIWVKLPSGFQEVTLAVYKSISCTSRADMPLPRDSTHPLPASARLHLAAWRVRVLCSPSCPSEAHLCQEAPCLPSLSFHQTCQEEKGHKDLPRKLR